MAFASQLTLTKRHTDTTAVSEVHRTPPLEIFTLKIQGFGIY